MNEMSPQLTPQQILDAARRAESEGRIDYALRFYRHLVEQHGASLESSIAADALGRLVGPKFLGQGSGPLPANGYANGIGDSYQHRPGRLTHHGEGIPPLGPSSGAHGRGRRERNRSGQYGGRGSGERALPEPRRGYLAGRVLALLLVWGGVFLMLAGMGIVGSIIGNVAPVLDILGIVPGFAGLQSGLMIIAGGVGVMFCGQFAQAVFEIANGVREMAEIKRYEVEQGSTPDGD